MLLPARTDHSCLVLSDHSCSTPQVYDVFSMQTSMYLAHFHHTAHSVLQKQLKHFSLHRKPARIKTLQQSVLHGLPFSTLNNLDLKGLNFGSSYFYCNWDLSLTGTKMTNSPQPLVPVLFYTFSSFRLSLLHSLRQYNRRPPS